MEIIHVTHSLPDMDITDPVPLPVYLSFPIVAHMSSRPLQVTEEMVISAQGTSTVTRSSLPPISILRRYPNNPVERLLNDCERWYHTTQGIL